MNSSRRRNRTASVSLASGSSGASTSTSTDIPQATNHSITIIKKKTAPVVTTGNLEKLFREGHILFENENSLSQSACLDYLKGNLMECKLALTNVISRDFRTFNRLIN